MISEYLNFNKIVIVTPWFGGFAGGAEVAARSFAQKIAECNINVEVFTTCCKSPYSDWWNDDYKDGIYQYDGFIVHRFPVDKHGKEKYEKAVINFSSGKTLNIQERFDFFRHGINSTKLIEYVSNQPTNFPIIALPYFQGLTYSLITNIPKRISFMPCFHDEPQFYWEPVGEMLNHCKNILYLSEEEKKMTISNYGLTMGKKVIEGMVIGVGLSYGVLAKYLQKDNRNTTDARVRFQLPDHYFLYLGRKEIGKGVRELVEWYPDFYYQQKRRNNIVPLVFVGGGDKTLVPKEECFIDLGFLSEEEKTEIIEHADGLINLSNNESFSLVIMEAWLNNTPVIVSDSCMVTKGHCIRSKGGFAVKNRNELVKVLSLIHTNHELGRILGKNGREYVQREFNWDVVLKRLFNGLAAKETLAECEY